MLLVNLINSSTKKRAIMVGGVLIINIKSTPPTFLGFFSFYWARLQNIRLVNCFLPVKYRLSLLYHPVNALSEIQQTTIWLLLPLI